MIYKFISYFTNLFTNNVKYNNSVWNPLKLYFERSTKLNLSLDLLGNLYKNSKWSSFHTQNIKLSWLKDWLYSTLFILLVLWIIFNFNIFNFIKYKLIMFYLGFVDTILPNIYFMGGLIFSFIYVAYQKLFFSKKINSKNNNLMIVKKSKYFTENYFFYKNLLNFKFSKLPTLTPYKDSFKLKSKLLKHTNNFFFETKNWFFFESTYTLKSSSFKETSLVIDLEKFSKLSNFRKDMILKDDLLLKKNPISKQQRWLNNNFLDSNSTINNLNKHILTKNFLESTLTNKDLFNNNIWASTKLNNISSELIVDNNVTKLTPLYNSYSSSFIFLTQRYNILTNLANNIFTNKLNFNNQTTYTNNKSFINFQTSFTQKNFLNNTQLYYFNLIHNKNKLNIKNIGVLESNYFYTLNTIDFLQKQDLILVNNLNTTTLQRNHYYFNLNFLKINYKV